MTPAAPTAASSVDPSVASLGPRIQRSLQRLEAGLLERAVAARLCLLAALAGEHVLLIGPPGSAKSELARRLHLAVAGGGYFERLLTRFSTPEELFGPLSLKALEDDRYERLIAGYLPTASVAFLDEVFKANSAILNALLTLLNERVYDHGNGRIHVPLACLVGATNDVPQDEGLRAFYDRFLVRVPVHSVGDASFEALLRLGDEAVDSDPSDTALNEADRAALRRAAAQVSLSDGTVQALVRLRGWLQSQGVAVSDRRWRQLVALVRVQAASEGRPQTDEVDLWLTPYVMSSDPAFCAEVARWFAEEVLQSVLHQAPWLTRAVEALENQYQIEVRADAAEGDDAAGKMALARAVGGHDTTQEMARLRSQRLEDALRKRYAPAHIEARVRQVREVRGHAARDEAEIAARADLLSERLSGRLWIADELAEAWSAPLRQSLSVLRGLGLRLDALADAFANLPVDAASASALAPEPVQLDGVAT